MIGIASEVWFPVVTLVVGIVLKGGFDALADHRALRTQKHLRDQEHRYASTTRRIAFQRETLLNLQECVQEASRAASEVFLADLNNAELGYDWSRAKIPEKINQKFFDAQRRLSLLQSRIRDEEVRAICAQMKSKMLNISVSKNQVDAIQLLDHISARSDELNER